jgi:ubiquinone biosynthesis protein
MIDPALTPTRLVRSDERQSLPIRPVAVPPRFYSARVIVRFFAWLLAIGWLRLTRRLTPEENARRLTGLLERLGGIWNMAGQLLSMRVDIFSPELCRELSSMQMRGARFPFADARRVVEQELGRPLEDIFDEFTPEPFAATWVCQIHRARLRREQIWTAVKVQRPEIAARCAHDLALVERLTRWLERLHVQPSIKWQVGAWELRQIVEQETDFRFEAAAIRRMKVNLPRKRVLVPDLFDSYSGARVLVTEFIHAALVSDYVRLQREAPARLGVWLLENEIAPQVVAKRLFHSLMRQLFEDNFYHGDLYPGNIVLLRDNRLALLHFGACGFTDREYLQKVRLFFRTLATRDYTKAADLTLMLCTRLPAVDIAEVKEDLVRSLRAWTARTYVAELPYDQKSIDNATVEVMKTLLQHGCTMDWGFLRIRRAIAILDASLVHLYPEANYSELCETYFKRAERRRIRNVNAGELATRVAGTALRGLDIQDRLSEFTMFYGAIIRRNAQVFQGTTDRFSYLTGTALSQVALLLGGIGLLLVAALVERAQPGVLAPLVGTQLAGAAARLPQVSAGVWIALVAADIYLMATAWRLRRRFLENRVRGPAATLGL